MMVPPANLAETVEVLLRMHEEERSMIRHFADQRATLGNVLVSIDAGLVGVLSIAASQNGLANVHGLPLVVAVGLAVSGAYGFFMNFVFVNRGDFHQRRSLYLRDRIEELLPATELQRLSHAASQEYESARKGSKRDFHTIDLKDVRSGKIILTEKTRSWMERRGFLMAWGWVHSGALVVGLGMAAWTLLR